ncbi:alpha-ketoglutarate-dependent dioxygenase AlkB [Flaviaesturariibacter amylovorans]|uniref:Alpha-ketoglutarate-dependent dioxygenase AlkB n=1 Tax=Flaviaesturariibacter amylovorans TaxID=1084520 RepID=A0ABP8HMF8_9BACT
MLTLFPVDPEYPEGFVYEEGFISAAEEAKLLEVVRALPLQTFTFQGYEAKRRIASYGYDYSFEEGRLKRGADIPEPFHPLVAQVARRIGKAPEALVELLVTEYPPGAVINWHRDAPPFGLIAGISLGTDCTFRLRPYEKALQVRAATRSLTVRRRSLYVMDGSARSEWQHSIAAVKQTRYSITLRTLK